MQRLYLLFVTTQAHLCGYNQFVSPISCSEKKLLKHKVENGLPVRKINVLLVNGRSIIGDGLNLLIRHQFDLHLMAEAFVFSEAVSQIGITKPDIVIYDLDSESDKTSQLKLFRLTELVNASHKSRVLALTDSTDSQFRYKALIAGARGVVRKHDSTENLLRAVRKIHAGEVYLDGEAAAVLLEEFFQIQHSTTQYNTNGNGVIVKTIPSEDVLKIARLTDRERQVVTLICEGLRNKQIAERLFISVITVRHHLSSIFSKLDLDDRFELAIYSYKYGLAKLPI